jgi:hypothetical protein
VAGVGCCRCHQGEKEELSIPAVARSRSGAVAANSGGRSGAGALGGVAMPVAVEAGDAGVGGQLADGRVLLEKLMQALAAAAGGR